jgi:hypothetical protein
MPEKQSHSENQANAFQTILRTRVRRRTAVGLIVVGTGATITGIGLREWVGFKNEETIANKADEILTKLHFLRIDSLQQPVIPPWGQTIFSTTEEKKVEREFSMLSHNQAKSVVAFKDQSGKLEALENGWNTVLTPNNTGSVRMPSGIWRLYARTVDRPIQIVQDKKNNIITVTDVYSQGKNENDAGKSFDGIPFPTGPIQSTTTYQNTYLYLVKEPALIA